MKSVEQVLGGWGNFPVEPCHVYHPQTVDKLTALVTSDAAPDYIARGLGRSYGDAAVNGNRGVVLQTRFDKFVSFDEHNGIMECEAGVSLGAIKRVFLPRGWFLPTTPGTQHVTVGGAIAADVHGKNHHRDGSFGSFVLDLKLLTANGDIVLCSAEENADIFRATVGGMGLTGIILTARIQLVRVESAYCDVLYRRTSDLDHALQCLDDHESDYRYSVAWLDGMATGKHLGRCIVMLGNDAHVKQLPATMRHRALSLPSKWQKTVPIRVPHGMLNSWTVRAVNGLYFLTHKDGQRIVDFDTFFYPLDSIGHWDRLYGHRGFVQYQAHFPPETSRRGLIELLEQLRQARRNSYLGVLKSSGPAGIGLLSFLSPGHTLALDFPNTGSDLRQFLQKLDDLVLKHGGRIYLAKDATTTADGFAAMYPALHEFRDLKSRIDPNCRFASSQARRLGIVENG